MNRALPTALLPGTPAALGAHADAGGVNFAVFSQHAARVQLCLYDASGERELQRLDLHGPDDGVFHGRLEGAGPGLLYGYRAHGPWQPAAGLRFNPHKLLLDPYARDIVGTFEWRDEHFGHVRGTPGGESQMDTRDSGPFALKARVTAPDAPAARTPATPRRPAAERVLYELHAKGFTMSLPGIPEALRGTYAGLAHPAAVAHFQALGITTLCLLPVHYALDEEALARRGLRNYWGYNTLGFFCASPRYATPGGPGAAAEFKAMVATLQAAGLEVVLDVVFNHSAEGDASGPTLSLRGLDNGSAYRLVPGDRRQYENHSGCGNTLRVIHPRITQLVLDALRYWVQVMGVDGFRFDLAPVLGRTRHGFDASAPFFVALRQDPTLANVHLIAEPWDTGPGGYQLGHFPGRFLEWNDRFRDAVRGYWLGTGVGRGEFARRFTGSSDLFQHGQRQPTASVNYVAAHDGYTLADVVSHRDRHNLANGEGNLDGHAHEVCANFGVEGESADPAVREARRRARRAMLATALLAQGTPMLAAGDEFGNRQGGNNNAYCQDNATGWLDWARADADDIALAAQLLALRHAHPLLRHPRWFAQGNSAGAAIHWQAPHGGEMQISDWHHGQERAFACQLAASGAAPPQWCLVFNPGDAPVPFTLAHGPWLGVFDSSAETNPPTPSPLTRFDAPARSLRLLRRDAPLQETADD
jgi:glycogen operon protein